jgi:hypothetical protein
MNKERDMDRGNEMGAPTEQQTLSNDLLDLYDELTDFNDCCAFLWDAFSALAAEEDALDTSTIEGLRSLADWMKQRMNTVKTRLKGIQERAAAEV